MLLADLRIRERDIALSLHVFKVQKRDLVEV